MPPAELRMRPGRRRSYSGRALLTATVLAIAIGSAHADERVFEVAIHSDAPTAEPAVLAVRQNDQVVVRFSSDKPLQIHLHGYDIEKDVVPNVVTPVRFTATATGRFPIEIHSNGPAKQRPVAYLEVRPR
jgi:hypothetical protein